MRRVAGGQRAARRDAAKPEEGGASIGKTVDEAKGANAKRRSRAPWSLAVIGAAALIAVVATTDRGRAPTDVLEECEDYAATLRRCFGDQAGVRAPAPPPTKQGRAAAAKRCAADRARIERACR
jgi:hypothetical protein